MRYEIKTKCIVAYSNEAYDGCVADECIDGWEPFASEPCDDGCHYRIRLKRLQQTSIEKEPHCGICHDDGFIYQDVTDYESRRIECPACKLDRMPQ